MSRALTHPAFARNNSDGNINYGYFYIILIMFLRRGVSFWEASWQGNKGDAEDNGSNTEGCNERINGRVVHASRPLPAPVHLKATRASGSGGRYVAASCPRAAASTPATQSNVGKKWPITARREGGGRGIKVGREGRPLKT
ncbi:hypothetical protein E2C01_020685 [Portunus trituberculatus]|uniref:Uncharacterized protein n=1 Tax=Portunus trituberculatus TaxID=210409 RepID=A0A5B7E446_PORTR|nr:hypothetical protein [Portunus trituberculatus]